MGASQSGQTRTVTMENPTPVGVIDVSDAVVQRLRNTLAKGESAAKESKATSKPADNDDAAKQRAAPQPAPPSAGVPSSYPTPGQYSPAAFVQQHGGEPTITAIEVRRQKDAELAQNDLYWRRRMQQLEQTLNKTNAVMEKEYSAAVEDVQARFKNAPPTHQLPPCQDLKTQLIACYRAHPGESLRCADEVSAFTNCVSQNRIKKLDSDQQKDGATKTDAVATKGSK